MNLVDLVTARELADFLGVSVRSLSAYQTLPFVALPGGKRLYFKTSAAEWLKARETTGLDLRAERRAAQ